MDRVYGDAENAYNEFDREVALKCMKDKFPEVFTIMNKTYATSSKVWLSAFEDEDPSYLTAEEGGNQGCSGATLLHGCSTLELYKDIQHIIKQSGNSNAFFKTYADDAVIISEHENSVQALKYYKEKGAKCGTYLNFGYNKTEVLLGRCNTLEEAQKRVQSYMQLGLPKQNIHIHPENDPDNKKSYGYTHLGIPVGSSEYITMYLTNYINKLKTESEILKNIEDNQTKWVFLYYVLSRKFYYILKHITPSLLTSEILTDISDMLKKVFENIVGQPIKNMSWDQARLSIKTGGFGIGYIEDIALASYYANVIETMPHVLEMLPNTKYYMNNTEEEHNNNSSSINMDNCSDHCKQFYQDITAMKESIHQHINTPELKERYVKQKHKMKLQHFYTQLLQNPRHEQWVQKCKEQGTLTDEARCLSVQGHNAGSFLWCIPKSTKLTFSSKEFQISMLLRLGEPLKNIPQKCDCSKKIILDDIGTHLLSCSKSNGANMRHKVIQNDFQVLATYAGYESTKEDPNLFTIIDSNDHDRGDILIKEIPYNGKKADASNIKNLLVDVTIGLPTAKSYVKKAAKEKLYLIGKLNEFKNDKYKQKCIEADMNFMPMAFEVFGAWSKETMSLFKFLIQQAADISGIPPSILHNYWAGRISTSLMKYNSLYIINKCSSILKQQAPTRDESLMMDDTVIRTYNYIS